MRGAPALFRSKGRQGADITGDSGTAGGTGSGATGASGAERASRRSRAAGKSKASAKASGRAKAPVLRIIKGLPRYWRRLNSALGSPAPSQQRLNLWLLVLEAKKIPHRLFPSGGGRNLYVPCLYEGPALNDIRAVEAERPVPAFAPPVRDSLAGVLALLILLFIWHGLRFGWFAPLALPPPFPEDPKAWSALFGLDMRAFRQSLELWRAGTALTLHADPAHLLSNLGFGLVFITALCRRAGLGLGILLVITGGLCGNMCNAAFQPLTDMLRPWLQEGTRHVISLGFSTSLFASVGALCALNSADILRHRKRFAHLLPERRGLIPALLKGLGAPLAAGLALLGILGGGGEAGVDYAAHIWGFICGLGLSFCALPLESKLFALQGRRHKLTQDLLFFIAFLLIGLCWVFALSAREGQ